MFFLLLSRAISIIDYESARSRRKSSVGKRSQAAASCAQHPSSRRALSVYCVLCLVTQLCPILHNPMGCSLPGYSVPWGFSRQEYWSGLPCPPPGDLPSPGTTSQVGPLPSEPPGKAFHSLQWHLLPIGSLPYSFKYLPAMICG